ncbi:MAG: ATP-binding protein [Acidobacteriota bacterium]|nr:ATP-binding protein [Acidobacteriota bacterium]
MPPLTVTGYALFGLTVMIAIVMVVAGVKIVKAISGRGGSRKPESRGESAMLSMALQEAVTKLKTQERATAARAEASERLASQIVEGLTSGLVVVDRAGIVQTINPAAGRILGIDDTAVQVPFRDVLATAPALADVIGEALEGGAPIARRTVALGGSSKPSHLGVTVSPISDAEGALQAAVCLFTDLTAVVELEEQLRLKEALARLGELTAGLAHEFRNGLATIHGYGRLLDPATLQEPHRAYIEGIRAETTALGEVVTNFLRFARPEQLVMAPVDLRAVIVRAIEDLPGDAVSVAGEFGTVDGDDVLLRQAFSNLVRNSLEACAAGGVTARIVITGEVSDRDVHVTVDDNGPGLAREALDRLFQPFATTKPTGTGLGLAIVQKVIVSHNGVISAGNRPDGGAQFRVRLPLSPNPDGLRA